MVPRRACLASLIALVPTAGLAEDCNGARAMLGGGYTINMGGGSMETTYKMHLERSGPGVTGHWTGTLHHTTVTFSAPTHTVPPDNPVHTIPGVQATCTTITPDSQTIDVRCEGS